MTSRRHSSLPSSSYLAREPEWTRSPTDCPAGLVGRGRDPWGRALHPEPSRPFPRASQPARHVGVCGLACFPGTVQDWKGAISH